METYISYLLDSDLFNLIQISEISPTKYDER